MEQSGRGNNMTGFLEFSSQWQQNSTRTNPTNAPNFGQYKYNWANSSTQNRVPANDPQFPSLGLGIDPSLQAHQEFVPGNASSFYIVPNLSGTGIDPSLQAHQVYDPQNDSSSYNVPNLNGTGIDPSIQAHRESVPRNASSSYNVPNLNGTEIEPSLQAHQDYIPRNASSSYNVPNLNGTGLGPSLQAHWENIPGNASSSYNVPNLNGNGRANAEEELFRPLNVVAPRNELASNDGANNTAYGNGNGNGNSNGFFSPGLMLDQFNQVSSVNGNVNALQGSNSNSLQNGWNYQNLDNGPNAPNNPNVNLINGADQEFNVGPNVGLSVYDPGWKSLGFEVDPILRAFKASNARTAISNISAASGYDIGTSSRLNANANNGFINNRGTRRDRPRWN